MVEQVAPGVEGLVLTGPADVATSWLGWLGVAFEPSPERFRHVHTVWRRAVCLRGLDLPWLDEPRQRRLELAALLHDVGRALDPEDTEPHGFVGARFLDDLGLHGVAPLVAHHSGARLEAAARGMTHLDVWVADDPDLLSVLTYLDRTTSRSGDRVSLVARRAELTARYGPRSRQVQIFDATSPETNRAVHLLAEVPGRSANRDLQAPAVIDLRVGPTWSARRAGSTTRL